MQVKGAGQVMQIKGAGQVHKVNIFVVTKNLITRMLGAGH